jgi:hypothetical protein
MSINSQIIKRQLYNETEKYLKSYFLKEDRPMFYNYMKKKTNIIIRVMKSTMECHFTSTTMAGSKNVSRLWNNQGSHTLLVEMKKCCNYFGTLFGSSL